LLSKLLRFRTLWAYGFDRAAPRAPEKSKVGEKEKYFISFNQLYFLKSYIEVTKRPERLSRGWQISLIMPSNGLGLLFFKNTPVCFRLACAVSTADRSNKLPASTCFITLFIQPTLSFFSESF